MGQSELLELLKNKNSWMLAIEIRKEMRLAPGAVNRLIKICYERGDIEKPAIEVIKEKKRLKNTKLKANAYHLKIK
ncbi:MAG: hypothetical protein QXG86_02545 [Candidatus Woesearchaeota archaeon]